MAAAVMQSFQSFRSRPSTAGANAAGSSQNLLKTVWKSLHQRLIGRVFIAVGAICTSLVLLAGAANARLYMR
jgi:hypothetical protein